MIGELLDSCHDPDGDMFAAFGAKALVLHGFLGMQPHAAIAAAIIMILAFLGIKLDGAEKLVGIAVLERRAQPCAATVGGAADSSSAPECFLVVVQFRAAPVSA